MPIAKPKKVLTTIARKYPDGYAPKIKHHATNVNAFAHLYALNPESDANWETLLHAHESLAHFILQESVRRQRA